MKKGLLLLMSILMSVALLAQDFAPVGAEWWYEKAFAFSGNISYSRFVSEGDTLLLGKECRKIVKYGQLTVISRPSVEYVYSEDGVVYLYDPPSNSFTTLYDFNANVGDSWYQKTMLHPLETDSALYVVESIDTLTVNGQDLKVLHTNFGEIVEVIGQMRYMLHTLSFLVSADIDIPEGVRCYEDANLGFYSTGIAESCDYTYIWTSVEESMNNPISIYPNPSSDFINIESGLSADFTYELISLNGAILREGVFREKDQIEFVDLESGIYLLSIYQNGALLMTEKVMKMGE